MTAQWWEDVEWHREVAGMTERDRSVSDTQSRTALGICGDKEDARSE